MGCNLGLPEKEETLYAAHVMFLNKICGVMQGGFLFILGASCCCGGVGDQLILVSSCWISIATAVIERSREIFATEMKMATLMFKINGKFRLKDKMALLGWGLARSLLSLAGVGLAFHLSRRKVQHLERRVLHLRGLHAKAIQEAEDIKERLYVTEIQKAEYVVLNEETSKDVLLLESEKMVLGKDVEGLEKRIQEYEEKLSLLEKKVEEYGCLNERASKDINHLKAEKQEFESSLETALQNLQRREQELLASSAENRKLELHLYNAVKKVEEREGEFDVLLTQKIQLENSLLEALAKGKEEQHAFEAYRKEAELSMATVLVNYREKERECEDLTVQKEEMRREMKLLIDEKIQHVRETEALNLIVAGLGDENMRLLKQVKDLKSRVKAVDAQSFNLQNDSELPVIQVPTAAVSSEDFFLSQNSSFSRLLEQQVRARDQRDEKPAVSSGSMSQDVGKTPSETNSCRRRLGPDRIASLKDLVSSCSRQGNVNMKQRIGKEVDSKEEAGNTREDDHKVSSNQILGSNWNQVQGHESLLSFYESPKQELDQSNDDKEKSGGFSASMNHVVGMAPSKTSNVRPRLGRDSIASLNNLVSSCSRRPAPFQGRDVKKRNNPELKRRE